MLLGCSIAPTLIGILPWFRKKGGTLQMKKHENGQVLVEYVFTLALLALVSILSVTLLLGEQIEEKFQAIDATGVFDAVTPDEDASVGQANVLSSAEQTALELDDVEESVQILWEAAAAQEESLGEGLDPTMEAVVEGLEVLIEHADDTNQPALSETLSQLMQNVKDGNLDAILDAITLLTTDLAEAPLEVSIAMSLKMAPRLIDSLAAISGGSVSPDTIAAAQQALEQLDPDHPGKTEAQQLLQEAVGIIEQRNNAIEEIAEAHCLVLGNIISALEAAGEEAWAAQFAAESAACGY
jgi:hypothetical protein